MKKTILFILGFSIYFLNYAQNFDPAVYQVGKRYPGYIIKLNNDTVRGYIEANIRCSNGGIGYSNQNRCEFYLSEADKKPVDKYGPKDIKGYLIADKFYKSIPYSGGLAKVNNFCLLVNEGRISKYVWYSTKEGFSGMSKSSSESQEEFDQRRYKIDEVFQKQEGNCYTYDGIVFSFVKKMGEIVSDYPEMAEKIKNKEKGYKSTNFFDIVKEYNAYFENKN